MTTVRVKQTAALQSQLGQGGMLNRDFSRASGFKVQNAYQNQVGSSYGMGGTIHVNKIQQEIFQFTKDKRPVSSHTLFKGGNNKPGDPRNQSGYVRRATNMIAESNTGLSFCDNATVKIE